MKLPSRILVAVRGPIVAATVASCASGAAPPEIVAEPTAPPDTVVPAAEIDPVAYDEEGERARLLGSELAVGAEGARRNRRIALNEARARALAAPRVPVNRPPDWSRVRCGRG